MTIKPLPDRELVQRLLRYDAATGEFAWLRRPREMFRNEQNFRSWNTRYAGRIAGNISPTGHRMIAIGHTQYRAHRLVWLYMHGETVPEVIDHVDHNKLNNRFTNLRAASKAENGANARRPTNSTTGIKGVAIFKGRFRARVVLHGKEHHLGYFDTMEEAAKARFEAASRLHGAFARHE
jgi:HNH endonuclease